MESKYRSFQLLSQAFIRDYFCIRKTINEMQESIKLLPINATSKSNPGITETIEKPEAISKKCKNHYNGYCTKTGRICPLKNSLLFKS